MSAWLDLFYRLNPLMRREMHRSLRSLRIHLLLFAMPAFLVLAMIRSPVGLLLGQRVTPGDAALSAFGFCVYYLAYLVMPALAAGSVLAERSSGSFEMLQTAGLNGWRILVGKTNGLFSVFGLILLTGLPILSVAAAAFGGVTGKEMVALYVLALSAAVRAAAVGFLAVVFVWNLVPALLLSYVFLFSWPWLLRGLALWAPELADYQMVLAPSEALAQLLRPGETPRVAMLGMSLPFWAANALFSLAFSAGCLAVASPLTVLPPSNRLAAFRPWLARLRWRRYRSRNLLPNRCNIVFERDFRMGLFAGSWLLYGIYGAAVLVGFTALGFWRLWTVEMVRLIVGVPLCVLLAARAALTINRLRSTHVIESLFLTRITPMGIVQAKTVFLLVTVLPLLAGAFAADLVHGFPAQTAFRQYSFTSVYLRAADTADMATRPGAVMAPPQRVFQRPLNVFLEQAAYGGLYYLQMLLNAAAVVVIGLTCSTQYNNANTAMLHALGWSAALVFLSNLLLWFVGFAVFVAVTLYFGAIGALSTAETGLALLLLRTLLLTLVFVFWAGYMLRYLVRQYRDAVRTLERSQKVDEFGAPPALYAPPPGPRDRPMETESWWGRRDF